MGSIERHLSRPLAVNLAVVVADRQTSRLVTGSDLYLCGALGGIRTPNLLIRSYKEVVRVGPCPSTKVALTSTYANGLTPTFRPRTASSVSVRDQCVTTEGHQ